MQESVYNIWHTRPFNGLLSGTTRVGWHQKKHSPTHTHPDHQASFINFLHLLWSIASSLFNLYIWQSFSTTSLQVLFGLSFGLGGTLYFILHTFFHPISSSFSNTCPYSCFTVVPMLCHLFLISLSALLGYLSSTLMPHIHLIILITFSFITGH